MEVALFDILGILFFATIALIIYRKGWFFSFYSFVKFIVVFTISFTAGLFLASKLPNFLPLNNLQLSLFTQGLIFLALWKIISFKAVFFKVTDKVIPINRILFVSGIDRILNIFPSLVVSFFLTFFVFTFLVSSSTNYPLLQYSIETSKIVKPLAYRIYFAGANMEADKFKLFNGVAFNTTPSTSFTNTNEQAAVPSGGTLAFTPDHVLPNTMPQKSPQVVAPTQPQTNVPTPTQPVPTPTTAPQGFTIIVFPTNIPSPTLTQTLPTPTHATFTPNPSTQIDIPTPTPTPIPTIVPSQPIINIFQPPPVNISTVEQDVLRLTNDQRIRNGLTAFAWDDRLASVARAHSQDMNDRNYFSHVNPDGVDPFARMRLAGISYSVGAENIAGAPTADLLVTNWMNSPGHRANILNPAYTKLGVGAATNSQYGILATQVFSN